MVEAEDNNERVGGSTKAPASGTAALLHNFHRDLMAGAVMGGVVHTIVAPIERAKLLLQTQESNMVIVQGGRRLKGMLDCIVRTVREEGVLSHWRGNGSNVLRYYSYVALNFSLKDLYINMLRNTESPVSNFFLGPSSNFITGSVAGYPTLILIYPLDIAHTRLTANVGSTNSHQFREIYHFLTTKRKKDGSRDEVEEDEDK